ncbi:MAG: DUF4340 domain-containing protein [Chloroflexi bacterium]|nr:DUF4340 domain-containing protein [Chloroflexota bacterium]
MESASLPAPRRKPLFQAGTWISVLMLAALVALAFYLNRSKENAAAEDLTPTLEKTFVFSAADGTVSSIEIKTAGGETVKIARDGENAWKVVLPIEAEANQGLAESAASQLSALSISSQIESGKPLEIFGLENPDYVVAIEFKEGGVHTLEIGDNTPTRKGYYVRLDKEKTMVVGASGVEALLNLVSSPPYLNTPTPTALPVTETATPAAEATATAAP